MFRLIQEDFLSKCHPVFGSRKELVREILWAISNFVAGPDGLEYFVSNEVFDKIATLMHS